MRKRLNPREVQDTRIKEYINTSSPEWLWELLPRSATAQETVLKARKTIENIMRGKDRRRLLIAGPCSVHSIEETLEYTRSLAETARKVRDRIILIARINIEKPRTLADWPGLLEDPFMDGSNDIETGRYRTRDLLLRINETGLPCATEYVNTSTPQYIGDLVSWSWVGARTVESQMHKRMASGLSTGVGFKNTASGDIKSAVNAVITAKSPCKFPGIKPNGKEATVSTVGNSYGVIILRGGEAPNYGERDIRAVQKILRANKLKPQIIIDCSHGNSNKNFRNQPKVFRNAVGQMTHNRGIIGLMLESYIKEGKQDFPPPGRLKKGVSITDSCIDLETTSELTGFMHRELSGGDSGCE